MEDQTTNCPCLYYLNPRTSFWVRMVFVIFLLSFPPVLVFLIFGVEWFQNLFGSGVYFTGCLGLLSFLLKNYWDGNRKRYSALCVLEAEILLQITTFQENIDKMDVLLQRDIPILATPTFVEPDLKILNDLGRIEIKNDAFNLLSRVADLKASIDFSSKTSLESVAQLVNPEVKKMAVERFRTNKECAEKFRDQLKELDVRIKFFIRNDKPFWSVPIRFFSRKHYMQFLKDEPARIQEYINRKNKPNQGPTYR